jgi:hypothetical protein
MKNNLQALHSFMYILPGTLLLQLNGFYESIPSFLISIFGCIILITGYRKLISISDQHFKKGVNMLNTAIYILIASLVIDLIPFLGIIATIGYIIGFGLQLYGFILIKDSPLLQQNGIDGINFLISSMALSIFGFFINLIPFFGDYFASYIFAIVFVLITFGWIKLFENFLNLE